jgi:hypothetical protein
MDSVPFLTSVLLLSFRGQIMQTGEKYSQELEIALTSNIMSGVSTHYPTIDFSL